MKKDTRILSVPLLIPLCVMVLITVAMVFLARGRERKLNGQKISLLPAMAAEQFQGEAPDARCFVCYNGEKEDSVKLSGNAADVLTRLHVSYRKIDLTKDQPDFSNCDQMLFCSGDVSLISEETFASFASWLDSGKLIWLTVPEINSSFRMIYRKLGISATGWKYVQSVHGLRFEDDFIPGLQGRVFQNIGLTDVALSVQTDSDCVVHVSDPETGTALIWNRKNLKGGSVTVFNNTLVLESYNFTGMIAAAFTEINDVFVWPVISAKAIFIDDFPAPQPAGFDDRLKEQFGYDTQGFFRNIWWPDMKSLADRHGLLYTGVLIEDYNENTDPPFAVGTADTLLQYYGAELINSGGEIGLHGYNHQPLILKGYRTLDNYEGWPSTENMAAALQELHRYAVGLFPEMLFTTYVPPSNNLSSEGYGVLKSNLSTISVVSGIYYDEEDGTGYRTDFTETDDGIVQVPRITSEYSMEEAIQIRLYCMLYMQGVVTHFIHPDDVLDEERGALLGWEKLLEDFDKELTNIEEFYSGVRGMTAASAGGAVQRCNRADIKTETLNGGLNISINNFYDEVWLALSCPGKMPGKIEGAELYRVKDGFYWLKCTQNSVFVEWD